MDTGTETVYTIAVVITKRRFIGRIGAYKQFIHVVKEFEGLAGITPLGLNHALLHMLTHNDAIIARNRLTFLGYAVSDNIEKVEVDRKYVKKENGDHA